MNTRWKVIITEGNSQSRWYTSCSFLLSKRRIRITPTLTTSCINQSLRYFVIVITQFVAKFHFPYISFLGSIVIIIIKNLVVSGINIVDILQEHSGFNIDVIHCQNLNTWPRFIEFSVQWTVRFQPRYCKFFYSFRPFKLSQCLETFVANLVTWF